MPSPHRKFLILNSSLQHWRNLPRGRPVSVLLSDVEEPPRMLAMIGLVLRTPLDVDAQREEQVAEFQRVLSLWNIGVEHTQGPRIDGALRRSRAQIEGLNPINGATRKFDGRACTDDPAAGDGLLNVCADAHTDGSDAVEPLAQAVGIGNPGAGQRQKLPPPCITRLAIERHVVAASDGGDLESARSVLASPALAETKLIVAARNARDEIEHFAGND